jgi:hypothetical protein
MSDLISGLVGIRDALSNCISLFEMVLKLSPRDGILSSRFLMGLRKSLTAFQREIKRIDMCSNFSNLVKN